MLHTMHYRPIDLHIVIEYNDDMYTLDITQVLHIGLHLSNKQLTQTTTTL